MCFVQIAGNRAALFIVPYHRVQRHSSSQAFPLLETQNPPRAIFCFFWLGKSQFLQSGFPPWCWWDPTLPNTSRPDTLQSNVSCGHKSNLCLFPGIRIELWNREWVGVLRLTSRKWKEHIFQKLAPHLHEEAEEGYLGFPYSPDHTHHFGDDQVLYWFWVSISPSVQSPLSLSPSCK